MSRTPATDKADATWTRGRGELETPRTRGREKPKVAQTMPR